MRETNGSPAGHENPYWILRGRLVVNGEPVRVDPRILRVALIAHRFHCGVDLLSRDGPLPAPVARRILQMERERCLTLISA